MPAPPVTQNPNATLHALTERLASSSRMNPFMSMGMGMGMGMSMGMGMGMGPAFPGNFSPQAMAAAASAYKQPAPPPQLPNCPMYARHQDQGLQDVPKGIDGVIVGDGKLRCPKGRAWGAPGEHQPKRSTALSDDEMSRFVEDMGIIMRREFDSWVEQCWTEAFHFLFSKTLPTLIISLIMAGATPSMLRRQVVQAGPHLDALFQNHMLSLLNTELENRLSGTRSNPVDNMPKPPMLLPNGAPAPVTDVGVCFHNLLYIHDPDMEEDDHGLCLCHLTTCPSCFSSAARARKGAYSLLPFELSNSPVARGWSGGFESEAQSQARKESRQPRPTTSVPLPPGVGFVRNPKPANPPSSTARPPPLFPHPQMTDVLAVEEHLRWRLKEMGASDPAVEARYGPCTNSPAALEGLEPREDGLEDGEGAMANGHGNASGNGKVPKGKPVMMTKGKGGKGRRPVNPTTPTAKKTTTKTKQVLLPKEWVDADAAERNMAIILTFRHFVKLLHQATIAASPFSYPGYAKDIDDINRVHPLALYRRLAELGQIRQAPANELRVWLACMDKWGEELGNKVKLEGNKLVSEQRWEQAVEQYTRAISLDPKNKIFFSNRAVALNALEEYERAEADCKHILSREAKNPKAYFQRAMARMGLGKWREAESDIKEVLRHQPDNVKAKEHLEAVRKEVAKLPKQSREDVLNF